MSAPGVPKGEGCAFNTFSWRPGVGRAELLVDVIAETGQARGVFLLDGPAAAAAARGGQPAAASLLFSDWGEWRTYAAVSTGWLCDGSGAWLIIDADEVHQLACLSALPSAAALLGETAPLPSLRLLTDGDADVIGERGASKVTASQSADCADSKHSLFFTRNAPNPESRQVYSVSIPSDGASSMPPIVAHTPAIEGCHDHQSSPDGKFLASVYSDDVTPPALSVFDVPDLSQRAITMPRPEFAPGGSIASTLVAPTYVRIPSTDGRFQLRLRVYAPEDGVNNGAAIVGPVYSNTVRNVWGRWSVFQQLLVQRGYTVLQVDVRGSTGNGRVFREEFTANVGGKDLEDLVATAAFARTLPSVTTGRVGCWGSSYGGTITLFALFKHPGVFDAGVAAAPAVDAAFYGPDDTAVVRRPTAARGEPDANYEKNSPQTFSAGLADPLLLIHGMQDDVVPFKTTMTLIEKLIEEGKSCFELATAAAATHNWAGQPAVGEYLFGRLLTHFDRHLLGVANPKL